VLSKTEHAGGVRTVLENCLSFFSRLCQSAGRFVSDNAQAVAAFAPQTMNQTARFFVREASGLAASLADD